MDRFGNNRYSCKVVEVADRSRQASKGYYQSISAKSPERAAIKAITSSRSIKIAAWHQGSNIYIVTQSVNRFEDVVLGRVVIIRES